MSDRRCPNALRLALALGWIAFAAWSTFRVLARGDRAIYDENGPIENAEVGLLAAAFLVFVAAAIRHRGPRRLILGFCALLSLNFILREVDVERLDLPAILVALGHGTGRNLMLIAGYVLVGVLALRRLRAQRAAARAFAASRAGRQLLAAAPLLFLAKGLDYAEDIDVLRHAEELAELAAYLLMLLCALDEVRGGRGEASAEDAHRPSRADS